MFKRIITCILSVVIVLSVSITAFADSSNSYIRVDVPGGESELRLSREMYCAVKEINAATFGLENKFSGITDIFSTKKGETYLLCGEESRIVLINEDYSKAREIVLTEKNGEPIDFNGASGIYCDSNDNIYVADTSNGRIIIANSNGIAERILETPDSDLLPDDFVFQPTSIAKDKQGYTYVLSNGCYYGALLYSPDYEFTGFYGANTVSASALDTLSYLWDKLTSNETKKSASVKKLPYAFKDFAFDHDGYMVTCTGATTSAVYSYNIDYGQIKKISNNGSNILNKRNLYGNYYSSSEVNFLEDEQTGLIVQELTSVDVSDDNYIFALDKGKGIIYIYDSECNLMSAFGGGYKNGERLGNFISPVAVSLNKNSVMVADSEKCSITIFDSTEYGNLIRQAQTLFIKGDYQEAKGLWTSVLEQNRNCQLAYRGLAMVYYSEGDYKAAMDAAEIAVDYYIYDLAWNQTVSNFVGDHFIIILLVVLLVIVGIFLIIRALHKRNKKVINNEKVLLMLKTPIHPFNSFEEIKYKKKGSMKIAIVITVLFYIASVLNVIGSGFLYTTTLIRNYNSLYSLVSSVGLLVLWSVCNWLVCSMFSGKGTLKEVYIATSYSLVPYILFLFFTAIVSNFIPLEYVGLVNGIGTVVLIFTVFLLIVGMITVHEYDFFKVALTSIVVIFFMILVVFVILLCGILIDQFGQFIVSIYDELVLR